MEKEIVERIKLIQEYFGLNQSEFAKQIGMRQQNYSRIINGVVAAGEGTINKIVMSFDINKQWIVSGDGEMFSPKSGTPHVEEVDAYCGKGCGFDVAIMKKDCVSYNTPGMDDADFTIKAKGRSMINSRHPDRSIKDGDYVGCKKTVSGVIRYGEAYALATSDGVMIKVIKKSKKEGYVVLESFNTEDGFEPFDFPIIDIVDMALVVAVASISKWA